MYMYMCMERYRRRYRYRHDGYFQTSRFRSLGSHCLKTKKKHTALSQDSGYGTQSGIRPSSWPQPPAGSLVPRHRCGW